MTEKERTVLQYYDQIKSMGRPPLIIHPPSRNASAWRAFCWRTAQSPKFDGAVSAVIALNLAVEVTRHYGQSEALGRFQEGSNLVFAVLFCGEALIKICALRLPQYLQSLSNCFDLSVTVCAVLDASQTLARCPNNLTLRLLRSLRAFRLLRLLKAMPGFEPLLLAVTHPFYLILNLCTVLLICIFVYASIGVELFGRADVSHNYVVSEFFHFGDLYHSMVLLFIMCTGEMWPAVFKEMLDNRPDGLGLEVYRCCTYIYFASFVLLLNFCLLNMFVMVICDSYDALKSPFLLTIDSNLPIVKAAWSEIDDARCGRLPRRALYRLLRKVPAPLGVGALAPWSEVRLRAALIKNTELVSIGGADSAANDEAGEMAYRDVLLQLVVLHVNGLGPQQERELRATLTLQALGRGIARRGAEKKAALAIQRRLRARKCRAETPAQLPVKTPLVPSFFDGHNFHAPAGQGVFVTVEL